MKNLTQVLIALFCLCMPALLHAQRDDSKYLAGAVPEVDGKVVFTKDTTLLRVLEHVLKCLQLIRYIYDAAVRFIELGKALRYITN